MVKTVNINDINRPYIIIYPGYHAMPTVKHKSWEFLIWGPHKLWILPTISGFAGLKRPKKADGWIMIDPGMEFARIDMICTWVRMNRRVLVWPKCHVILTLPSHLPTWPIISNARHPFASCLPPTFKVSTKHTIDQPFTSHLSNFSVQFIVHLFRWQSGLRRERIRPRRPLAIRRVSNRLEGTGKSGTMGHHLVANYPRLVSGL